MRALTLLSLAAALGAVPTLAETEAEAGEPAVRFERLAPGVVVALQPEANWLNDANAAMLLTTDGVIVIDAPSDERVVERTIREIEQRSAWYGAAAVASGDDAGDQPLGLQASDLPVRFLINTHWHSDHTQGNDLYRRRYGDTMVIVGHTSLREEVPVRAGGYIAEQREKLAEIIPRASEQLAAGLSLGGEPLDETQREQQRLAIERAKRQLASYEQVEMRPPDLTYDSRLTLHLGGRTVELYHFRAHTAGDTVVYLPDEKILFTGDLLDVLPFAGHGYLQSWIETLDVLAGLDVERIVPGHGPVFEGPVFEGATQLELLRDYFQAIVDGVRAALADGLTAEEAAATIDLNRYREALAGQDATLLRNFDAFAPETITRAYAELSRGEPRAAE